MRHFMHHREFTTKTLLDMADVEIEFDALPISLIFAVTSEGYDVEDRSSGFCGGWDVKCECVGAILSSAGDVALTRDQVIAIYGRDQIAAAEIAAAKQRASELDAA